MKRNDPPFRSGPGAERKRVVGELPLIRSDAGRATSPSASAQRSGASASFAAVPAGAVVITAFPLGDSRFQARCGGQLIVARTRQPLFDGARALLAAGYHPDTSSSCGTLAATLMRSLHGSEPRPGSTSRKAATAPSSVHSGMPRCVRWIGRSLRERARPEPPPHLHKRPLAIASPPTGPNLREHDRRGKRGRAPAVEDLVNTAIPAPLTNDVLASRRRTPSRQKPRM